METTLHPLTIPFAQVTYDSIKPDIGGGRIGQVKKATLNDRSVALRFMKLLETGSIDEPELEKNNTTSAAVDDTQSPTAGASSAKLITDEFLSAEVARLKCGNGKNNQPRLVQFLGVYIPKDGYSFALVYEFMQRGGLDTFISKNRTGIQWETRISIILDLTEGMAWLHSRDALWLKPLDGGGGDALKSSNSSLTSINLNILQGWSIHGNLKSSNVLLCMEEGVMRAKISDIGLMEIKSKAISDYNRRRGIVEAKETDEAAVINPNSIYNAPELFHIPKVDSNIFQTFQFEFLFW